MGGLKIVENPIKREGRFPREAGHHFFEKVLSAARPGGRKRWGIGTVPSPRKWAHSGSLIGLWRIIFIVPGFFVVKMTLPKKVRPLDSSSAQDENKGGSDST
jgi:hypothetical protein